MKSKIKLFSIGLIILMLSSCAIFQQKPKNIVMSYEVMGTVLTEFQRKAKLFCDTGFIKASDCEELTTRYNQARTLFISAGNVLALGINDPSNLELFTDNMAELNKILLIMIQIMESYGIQIQGVNK